MFEHEGETFRVNGWLKRMAPPELPADQRSLFVDGLHELLYENQRRLGPDRVRLVFCLREEAEYVSASGIAGCIVRVRDVVVSGRVPWAEDVIDRQRRIALAVIGHTPS
jgi:hypothetical protein